MANERLYQFPSKAVPVPADILFAGDSANSFDEVQITIAELIAAYPNLSGIAGLTLGANTYPYVNNSSTFVAGTITALGVSLLANASITQMQSTLGYTATPTATRFAGWDANLNLSANNFLSGYATTATAAGTTTLLVGSAYQQFFTGSTTQTVLLPVTSTLVLGQSFYIVNNSSGTVTVQSSGGNTIQAMAANTTLLVTCILTSGTTAASWASDYNNQTVLTLPLSVANGGTGSGSVVVVPAATAWAGWDANKNISANNFLASYTTTATAAGTTTLTVASTYQQFFTGSTTQTVQMPVVSTLVLGQTYYLVNNSSGNVTVQSSGGNTILTMTTNTEAYLVCVSTSGTGTASWYFSFLNKVESTGTVTSVSTSNGITGGPITTTGTVSLASMFNINSGAPANAFTMDANGVTTHPNNPFFSAHVTTTSAAVTGDGTLYTIASYTSDHDVTSSFNASTGVFTAPVAGVYVFKGLVALGGLAAGNTNGQFYFVGGSGDYINYSNWGAMRNGSNQLFQTGTMICTLAANATVSLQIVENGNGSKNVTVIGGAGNTVFSGCLIG